MYKVSHHALDNRLHDPFNFHQWNHQTTWMHPTKMKYMSAHIRSSQLPS